MFGVFSFIIYLISLMSMAKYYNIAFFGKIDENNNHVKGIAEKDDENIEGNVFLILLTIFTPILNTITSITYWWNNPPLEKSPINKFKYIKRNLSNRLKIVAELFIRDIWKK